MYKFIMAVFGPLAKLLFRIKISFEEPFPTEGPVIICGKHISAPDPFFAMAAVKRPIHYMAKASIFEKKFFKWFLTKMYVYPVKRGAVDKKSFETSISLLEQGNVLGIYPEGTRVRGIDDMSLKTGAMHLAVKTGAVIIPLGMYTKNYKVHIFKRTYLRFGKAIHVENLPEEDITREKLQELTNTVLKSELLRLSQEKYEPKV